MKSNAKIAVVFCIALTLFSLAITFLFGNPRVSYDGWQYLSSAKSIQDGTLAENFFGLDSPVTLSLLTSVFLYTIRFGL